MVIMVASVGIKHYWNLLDRGIKAHLGAGGQHPCTGGAERGDLACH